MTASKHYFSLKGDDAEEFAFNLASKCFLEDWCYMNPKRPDGKELCDLLIVYDTTAIIFAIKSLKIGADGRYKPSKIDENVRQLHGAHRRLLDINRPLTLINPRRGSETFDPGIIKTVRLVSVVVGDGEHVSRLYHDRDGQLSHMFTGGFLESALNELDTVSDFLQYLAAKEELYGQTHLIIVGGEEELLAYYLLHGRSFQGLMAHKSTMIDDGHWEELHERDEYIAQQRENEVSYAWDGMIGRAHEAGVPEYEAIARELARPDRFGRRMLAKAFLDGWHVADADTEHDVFRRTMSLDGTTYCFLYMDDDHPENENRRTQLAAMCHVARKMMPSNTLVVGVATDKSFARTCSYDFGRVEISEWTDEHEAQAATIQSELGLFADTKLWSFSGDEYPVPD